MTLELYQTLTGTTVSDIPLFEARLAKTQAILEALLGYTLNSELVDDNQYVELGKTQAECECWNVNTEQLEPADEVVGAYRLFPYYPDDPFLGIDPASAVYAVKIVQNGVTFNTLDPDEYCVHWKNGIATYIEQKTWFCSCNQPCHCSQLAVDADWLWPTDLPADLLGIWAEMITYYSAEKKNIKSESLGSHSYTFSDSTRSPETESVSSSILQRYAGPNGLMRSQRV